MSKRLFLKLGDWCAVTAPMSAMILIAINPTWATVWYWRALLFVNAWLIFSREQRARRTRALLHDVTAQFKRFNDERDRTRDQETARRRPARQVPTVSTSPRTIVDTTMCEENDAPIEGGGQRARGGTDRP